jgi:DNA recombination protein RmuC
VLEQCGLSEHTDFITEHSIETDEGRLRPDAIVRIPGNKQLVIDAKVSLNAYQAAFEANDDAERTRPPRPARALDAQPRADARDQVVPVAVRGGARLRGHVRARRALRRRRARARSRAVGLRLPQQGVLATPTNLVAICPHRRPRSGGRTASPPRRARSADGRRTATIGWPSRPITSRASAPGSTGGAQVQRLRRQLRAQRAVLGQRLREKHIEIGKREIEEVPLVESAPRYVRRDDPPTPRLVDTSADEEARSAG